MGPAPVQVLKVGGIQAARPRETTELINTLKTQGPLSVVLSAPNSPTFRTTNVLIEAATALAGGDCNGAIQKLQSVEEFVVSLLGDIEDSSHIQNSLQALFQEQYDAIDSYGKIHSTHPRFSRSEPSPETDFVASIWKNGRSHGFRSPRTLLTVIPFVELGENISAIIYGHLTGGHVVKSRDWMGGEMMEQVRWRVCEMSPLIISGALRMSAYVRILPRLSRGYTDANAAKIAALTGAHLLVHKEFPISSGDPNILNGRSVHLQKVSLGTIRSSLHPLVGAQFLNAHTFDTGIPERVSVGVIGTDKVTDILDEDFEEGIPLVQIGPRVIQHTPNMENFDELEVTDRGVSRLVSVLFQSPVAGDFLQEANALYPAYRIGLLDDRTLSILVPNERAEEVMKELHEKFVLEKFLK